MRGIWVLLGAMAWACGSETSSGPSSTGGTGATSTGGTGATSTGGSGATTQDASDEGLGGAAGGTPCKGPGSSDCASDEYCAAPTPDTCVMDSSPDGGVKPGPFDGSCTKRPASCPSDCKFACGYDGNAYCNACLAHQAGIEAVSRCPICPELHKPCSDQSECVYGLKCCMFSCPYPTGCGDAATPVTCEEPDPVTGQCPIAA